MANNYVDYFNPKDVTYEYVFPDKCSKLTFRKLTEGDRAVLQDSGSALEMNKDTNTFRYEIGQGKKRIETIKRALMAWDIKTMNRDGELVGVPFTRENVDTLINKMEPELVDEIYGVIVDHNVWIRGSKTSDEIREEISRLEEQLKEVEGREKKLKD